MQKEAVAHREQGKKVKTALVMLSVAAAFFIGFIISHWQ
ncbi:MAG TPA: cytochrome oxidase small assembly protein [Burkholderiales bacterium]|nr:cytochrome oxidase small assembly protein [Burkholderiales bacterium]